MTALAILAWLLAYLGIGVIFLLCYILALKPQPKSTQLGLLAIFWPAVLVIDLVLALALEFGKAGQYLANRFKRG